MRETEDAHIDRVGNEGADDAGDQRVAFKILAVEHLDAGDGRA